MFRRSAFVSVPIVLGALSYRNLSFNAESWPFDTKVSSSYSLTTVTVVAPT